ncbi:MAG: hypothetical protein ACXABY_23080 [Candidatus Thorarchaeota archaeon]|jgi:hypothetical protein
MIKDYVDFRGGYATDIPSEQLRDNEMLVAENCYWQSGLAKRKGVSKYVTTFGATSVSPLGSIRAYMNDDWYTIFAVASAAGVDWYRASGTALTNMSATGSFTIGNNVEMARLNNEVLAVNGVDDPAVIRFSSTFIVQTLDSYDVRTRGTSTWYGGAYQASASGSDDWIDDTTDLQSTATADFIFATTATNDGFYFACDYRFNKLLLYNVHTLTCTAGLAVAYEYYEGSNSWTALTMVTSASWDAATGTRTLEWDWPTTWTTFDYAYGDLSNRYVMRTRFTTPPTATGTLAYGEMSHTQFITDMLANEKPQAVATHNNRLHMAAGNIVNISPYNAITGWQAGQVEYFTKGGNTIRGLESHSDYLFVAKDRGIFGLFFDSYQGWRRETFDLDRGTISGRSVKTAGNYIWFLDRDGLYRWDGKIAIKVSKHIQSDIDSYTLTDACAVNYREWYYLSFPTNDRVLTLDPDTYRGEPMGDGRVSFYKYLAEDNYHATQFMKYNGAGDVGGLYGLSETPSGTWYVAQFDSGTHDEIAGSATIVTTMRTGENSFKKPQEFKRFGILKPHFIGASVSAGQANYITLYGRNGQASSSITVNADTGTATYSTDLRVPHKIDGKTFGLKWEHQSMYNAKLISYSIDYQKRYY